MQGYGTLFYAVKNLESAEKWGKRAEKGGKRRKRRKKADNGE
jgi:hypothetical protein